MSVSRIRPWFLEDLLAVLSAVYFSGRTASRGREYLIGFLSALVAVAIAVGIQPAEFLAGKDVELLKEKHGNQR